jgi:hypothetical protein
LLIYKLQHRFHLEPLWIPDTINLGPAFRPESLQKILFPSHATIARPPSRKRLEHSPPPLGPHHCHYRRRHRPCARTSSTQPLQPLHRCHRWSTTEDLYVSVPHTSALHLSSTVVDLQAPLSPLSTSCRSSPSPFLLCLGSMCELYC